MSEAVLSTNTLPSPIREKFNTQKIIIKNYESGVILMPLKDISNFRGIAKGSSFTTATLLSYRKDESLAEDNGASK